MLFSIYEFGIIKKSVGHSESMSMVHLHFQSLTKLLLLISKMSAVAVPAELEGEPWKSPGLVSTEPDGTNIQDVGDDVTAQDISHAPLERRRARTRRGGVKRRTKRRPVPSRASEDGNRYNRRWQNRAQRHYENQMRNGMAMAPPNSTQFIMADHGSATPQGARSPNRHELMLLLSADGDSSLSEADYSGEDGTAPGETFYDRDFDKEYNEIHADLLNSYSKELLVEKCLDLQHQVDELESAIRSASKLLRRQSVRLKQVKRELDAKPAPCKESTCNLHGADTTCQHSKASE